jgi:hypothetical protein
MRFVEVALATSFGNSKVRFWTPYIRILLSPMQVVIETR